MTKVVRRPPAIDCYRRLSKLGCAGRCTACRSVRQGLRGPSRCRVKTEQGRIGTSEASISRAPHPEARPEWNLLRDLKRLREADRDRPRPADRPTEKVFSACMRMRVLPPIADRRSTEARRRPTQFRCAQWVNGKRRAAVAAEDGAIDGHTDGLQKNRVALGIGAAPRIGRGRTGADYRARVLRRRESNGWIQGFPLHSSSSFKSAVGRSWHTDAARAVSAK